MPATAALSGAPWRVTPGETAEIAVMIRNAGSTVDHFTVEVVGLPAEWSTVEPAVVALLPGAAGDVVVRMHPPASGLLAGSVPFGVRVVSEADSSSVVEEGAIEVLAVAVMGAELRPRTSEGRSAQHVVHVQNQGNTAFEATVAVDDPDEQLLFRLERNTVNVGPGETAAVPFRVAGRRRTGGHRRFQVRVESPGSAPVVLEGALSVPHPASSRWPKLVVAAALIAVVALITAQLRSDRGEGDLVTTKPVRLQHTFAAAEADGLKTERSWQYSVEGQLLENALTVSNATGEPRNAVVFEVVPKEVAAHVSAVRFDPPPAEVIEEDPVVRYDVPLEPGGSAILRWEANLPTALGATGLAALASKRDEADRKFHESRQSLVETAGAAEDTAVVPPQDTTPPAPRSGASGGATGTTSKVGSTGGGGSGGGTGPVETAPPAGGGGGQTAPETAPPAAVSAPGSVASAVVKDPAAARVVNGVPEEVRVTVEWGAPASDGGQAPTAYRIRCTLMKEDAVYDESGSTPAPCKGGAVVATASGSVRSTSVVTERVEPGPGTWLKWEVAAENSGGVGPYRAATVVVPNLLGLYSWEAFPFGRVVGLRTHGSAPYACGRKQAQICSQSLGAGEVHPVGAHFVVREQSS